MTEVKYTQEVSTTASKGIYKQTGMKMEKGVRLDKNDKPFNVVVLKPVNTYGLSPYCALEIPLENVDDFIKQLKKLKQ